MKRLVIVSNRLPVGIEIEDNKIDVKPNVGGLATGMRSVSQKYDSLWIGWSGLYAEDLSLEMRRKTDEALKKKNAFLCISGRKKLKNITTVSVTVPSGPFSTILHNIRNTTRNSGKPMLRSIAGLPVF